MLAPMNSARSFIRRADDDPPRTPPESPFRRFDVKCLKCGSYRLALTSGFDETTGEQFIAHLLPLPPARRLEAALTALI